VSRSRSHRVVFGLVMGLTAIAGGGPLFAAHGSAAAVTRYPAGITGVSSPVHGQTTAATRAPAGIVRGVRSRPRTGGGTSAALRRPTATAAKVRTKTSLLHNFNGVSSRDSAVTNYGQEFEPPDQGLCVGNNFVLESVNSAYTVYRPDGTSVAGPFNVNDLYNEGAIEFTSDPRCDFDPTTHTWFATILFISGGESAAGNTSHLDVAVNPTGDPTTVWTEYQFDTTDKGGNGCPCFGDQPTLGIDHNNLYVTTDEFSILGPQFNGAQIYAFSKADMRAAKPAHFVHFSHLDIGGTMASTVQPAITTGAASAEFFMNSLDPNLTFDDRLGVWALTNGQAVATGHSPTLSSIVITSEIYGVPPGAQQKGAKSLLDSGDDRMQQTQFINGRLWGEMTTAITIPNDPAERAAAGWFDVNPTLSGALIGGATIAHQGYVADPGSYVIYPALQSDAAGNVVMVFTDTGSARFASAAYAALGAGQSQFGAINIAAAGSGPYDRKATRWGDYSWAVLDPTADAVWLATEYMPPPASQTPDRLRNWGTEVLEVGVS